jgi:acyl-CoA:acyl-CoA alkyltransferase
MKVRIREVSAYLPEKPVSNHDIELLVNQQTNILPAGALERLFGSQERRFAAPDEQVSDLAMKAALPIVEKVGRNQIDCLIFSAACADMIEPATANIVQNKLGLDCPVFDLKNACNSFVTAMQVAGSMIQTGLYRRVLVVNGEKLQDAIRFDIPADADLRRYLAGLTLGDAGAAMLLEGSDDESGIIYQKFKTRGQYWELCTVPGGGSRHPHTSAFNYFEGRTSEMRQAFLDEFDDCFEEAFEATGLSPFDIQHYFMHQVSASTFDVVARHCKLPRERFVHSFEKYGNIAAATIPVNLAELAQQGKLKKNDKVMLIGIAAGISIGVQILVW